MDKAPFWLMGLPCMSIFVVWGCFNSSVRWGTNRRHKNSALGFIKHEYQILKGFSKSAWNRTSKASYIWSLGWINIINVNFVIFSSSLVFVILGILCSSSIRNIVATSLPIERLIQSPWERLSYSWKWGCLNYLFDAFSLTLNWYCVSQKMKPPHSP